MASLRSSPEALMAVSKRLAKSRGLLYPSDSRWPYHIAVNFSTHTSPLSEVPSAKTNVELPENSARSRSHG
jgi:hypothetical protein